MIILDIYVANMGAHSFIKQMLLDVETWINLNPVIVSEFNTPLSPVYRSTQKQKLVAS